MFKIGDKVKFDDDELLGSWSGVIAIIIGMNYGGFDGRFRFKKFNNPEEEGHTSSIIFKKITKEIKVFDDE